MKVIGLSSRPRLPLAARIKLRQGSVHGNGKKYNRRREKSRARQIEISGVFII